MKAPDVIDNTQAVHQPWPMLAFAESVGTPRSCRVAMSRPSEACP